MAGEPATSVLLEVSSLWWQIHGGTWWLRFVGFTLWRYFGGFTLVWTIVMCFSPFAKEGMSLRVSVGQSRWLVSAPHTVAGISIGGTIRVALR